MDYYPFGWEMPGRSVNPERARFTFNGIEQTPELSSGHLSTFFREYDARNPRWWATDPYNQYHSPYLFSGNNPITTVDPSGGWGGKRKAKEYANAHGISHDRIYKDGNGNYGIDEATITYDSDGLITEVEVTSHNFGKSDWGSFWSGTAQHGYEFASGVGNTLSAANIGTDVINKEGNDSYSNTYRVGQVVGNVVAGVQGAVEIVGSAAGLAAGGGISGGSAGTLSLAGAGIATGSAALGLHGMSVLNNAWNNSMKMSFDDDDFDIPLKKGQDHMKGGKKAERDKDFGIKDKGFWNWWHTIKSKMSGKGRSKDIKSKEQADELYDEYKNLD